MNQRASRFVLGIYTTFGLALIQTVPVATAQPDYVHFESGLVRPLAMSADGARLFAVNAPDGYLEVFDLTGPDPVHLTSVPVGLEPVAVAVESPSRVWVVNHLSDSVSVVDVEAAVPHVVSTLYVGDEPRDIVFAGPGRRRAFITTAHRGQNTPNPRGDYNVPGTGRADVWVFDADNLGGLGGRPLSIVNLFGDVPRALAVSPDGSRVYASVFLSGNGTTALNDGVVCDGGVAAASCGRGIGGLPAPNANAAGVRGPEVGLIVRHNGSAFVDELGRDWSEQVSFDLPDYDVFAIDAMAAEPAADGARWSGVGTVNYAMAVHPSGRLYVANTEARNEVRFEGHGTLIREMGLREGQPASVRSHLHEARITVIDGDEVTPVHLNPHLDYEAEVVAPDVRWRTLSMPTALAMNAAGDTLYVAALGSSSIGVLSVAELDDGTVTTELGRSIPLRTPWPGGPMGLVLDEARERLYALNRFDNSVAIIDTAARAELNRLPMHTPEPAAVIQGRPILYDALSTSSHGESSCGSCHVFGDLDGLAWDLGNPDGLVAESRNPGPMQAFHPMKGPMTTQSLRGMSNAGPMHWRGDRTGGVDGDPLDEEAAFVTFNGAFDDLLGRREGPITDEEMLRFARFALAITYPPNPIRQLDNSLRPDEARASDGYFTVNFDPIATCDGCHTHDRAEGFFGASGATTFEGETQDFKVAHLRNIYQKVGMFGAPGGTHLGPQVRGFGFLHDGSMDTVLNFFRSGVFSGFSGDAQRAEMEALMMAFDSDLPPIVGQQVTGPVGPGEFLERATVLTERATAPLEWPGGLTTRECDLVARGVVDGVMRGYWLNESGMFVSDVAADAPFEPLGLAGRFEGPATLTCVPPGSGPRMATDRDGDGVLDGDERAAGTNPAERAAIPIPVIEVVGPGGTTPPVDGGMPADGSVPIVDGSFGDAAGGDAGADAGADAASHDDPGSGCDCGVSGNNSAPLTSLVLLGLVLLRIGRRRQ